MTVLRAGMAACVLGIVAAACGVPTGGTPQRIDPMLVPFGLAQPATSTPAPSRGYAVTLYFVDGARLEPLREHVHDPNVPAAALRALLSGVPPAPTRRGVVTAIPPETRLISLDVNRDNAVVDLSRPFGSLGGSQQVLAVAQIVYTLTSVRQIDGVSFAIQGHRVEVPDGSGSLTLAPRTRSDYALQAPH